METPSNTTRHFTGTITMEISEVEPGRTVTAIGGRHVGAPLTDNNYVDDGYRFHDVFHLALAVYVGWSPTLRHLMRLTTHKGGKGRKEDGTLDEGIVALIFSRVQSLNFLQSGERVEPWIIHRLQEMTKRMDVPHGAAANWEWAITEGTRVWLQIRKNRGGSIETDFDRRTMTVAREQQQNANTQQMRGQDRETDPGKPDKLNWLREHRKQNGSTFRKALDAWDAEYPKTSPDEKTKA